MHSNEELNKEVNYMKADELRSRIKEYCKQHYISHTRFGVEAGISSGAMSEFMRGKRIARNETIEKLSKRLRKNAAIHEIVIDLDDLDSIANGLEVLYDYREKLRNDILEQEQNLSSKYKLCEMMDKFCTEK